MEIVLSKEDIEKILREKYNNVDDIKFSSKNPKVVMKVSSFNDSKIVSKGNVEQESVTEHNVQTKMVESTPKRKPKVAVMGSERKIMEL